MASAVPLFNGLRHLPCPKEAGGQTCTTPGCLFGHARDEKASTVPNQQSAEAPTGQDGLEDGGRGAPPSKRQKIGLQQPRRGESEDGKRPADLVDKVQASDVYDPLSPPIVGETPLGKSPRATNHTTIQNQTTTPPRQQATQSLRATQSPLSSTQSWVDTASPAKPTSATKTSNTSDPNAAPLMATGTHQTSAASQLGTSPSGKTVTPLSRVKVVKPPSQSTAGPSTQKAKALRKAESLNPRHLTTAPAAHGVRHKLLSLLHDDFNRLNKGVSTKATKDVELKGLVMNPQQLIWMALDREHELATQRPALYNNAMRHEVTKYKKMQVDTWIAERKKSLEKKPPSQKVPGIGAPVVISTGLTPAEETVMVRRLVSSLKGLDQYGFVLAPPTGEQIRESTQAVEWSKGWEQCDRCTARFQIFPGRNLETGELASGGQCTHHPGKLYMPQRTLGATVPRKHRCCNQDQGESPGCTVGSTHVWRTSDPKRLASLWQFVETPANNGPLVKEAVAFDCEMAFTVQGFEVVRLTATSWPDGGILFDVLVQPYGEILDLNSKYSGVWPEDMANAVAWTQDGVNQPQEPGQRKILQKVSSPDVARDLLFSHINSDTILIGHGLENDLNAMRMIHHNIVDTALLYPHKRGLPIRSSLKGLMEFLLNRRIQEMTGQGHDSAEDARAAGDLVRFKVQKEWQLMKTQGWTWVDSELRPKGWKLDAVAIQSKQDSPKLFDTDGQVVPLVEESPEANKS